LNHRASTHRLSSDLEVRSVAASDALRSGETTGDCFLWLLRAILFGRPHKPSSFTIFLARSRRWSFPQERRSPSRLWWLD